MSWWGKIAGGGIGLVLGGPLGGMLGAVLGHQVDKAKKLKAGFDPNSQETAQAALFPNLLIGIFLGNMLTDWTEMTISDVFTILNNSCRCNSDSIFASHISLFLA